MSTITAPSHPLSALSATPATTGVGGDDAEATADRFLKLLVAQMRNQDPLNPLDNAQVTSQMAQINTVSGIDRVNASVKSLGGQFIQMQALQGAALVGREVTVAGNRVRVAEGRGEGAFELASAADAVKIEILGAGNTVVDTVTLGGMAAGMQRFEWNAGSRSDAEGYRFRVVASRAGAVVDASAYMLDRVRSVSAGGDSLALDLTRLGPVSYGDVKTIH
jgi:flagellar basal-body rod modification protein FlgD